MSDTPRTDFAEANAKPWNGLVAAEFARQLERELAEARRIIERNDLRNEEDARAQLKMQQELKATRNLLANLRMTVQDAVDVVKSLEPRNRILHEWHAALAAIDEAMKATDSPPRP